MNLTRRTDTGNARWNPSDWTDYSRRTTAGRSREDVFARSRIREDFDPRHIRLRESRDSEANPQSNAIIVAFDETGSMGAIPDAFVREGLGTMAEEILNRAPVTDPHTMIMGVGDAWHDEAPLQVTQFEADLRIAEQLRDIYLEGCGGGNAYESYNLPWYFAARRTALDCFERRGRKGYLFTIGDEPPPPVLRAEHVKRFLGEDIGQDIPTRDVLTMASRTYEVFHVVVEQGHYYQRDGVGVRRAWTDLLGQRVLFLSDYRRLAEVIVSAIEINEGRDGAAVADSWSAETALVVSKAVGGLTRRAGSSGGVVRL